MTDSFNKVLAILLKIISITTTINMLVLYWLPINMPLSSFSAVRLTVVAFIEKRYYLILVSVLICILLFLSTLSVRRQHIILPSLSLLYLIYDFIMVTSLLVDGLYDGYWKTYVIRTILSIPLIVLLCVYCLNYIRQSRQSRDGSMIDTENE